MLPTTMHGEYQNEQGALPWSSFAPYTTNTPHSSLQGEIGNAVSSFVQTTENKLSQWFWDAIGSLPKNYFPKSLNHVNCADKSLWEGIFNDCIEILQEQLTAELAEQKSYGSLQDVRNGEPVRVDKLKEMSSGLPQGRLSLEERLTDLQGLIGKYALSPQDYEAGLNALKETTPYTTLIEQVRTSFRFKLKEEQVFLAECLQGDLLHLCKVSPEKSLTPATLNKLLSYYKPLMKHRAYATHKEWVKQCYNTQSLLPPPPISKHMTTSAPTEGLSSREANQNNPIWNNSIRNFGKFLWENSGKLMTLGLATQVIAVQAFPNSTTVDLVPEGNSADRFSIMPMLAMNQTTWKTNPYNISDYAGSNEHMEISEELRLDILHQFDTISDVLQELAKIFSTYGDSHKPTALSRVTRSLPVEESTMCEIEKDTLIHFRDKLQVTLKQPNQAGNYSNNCELNFKEDRCNELINLVLCGYKHLSEAFLKAALGNNLALHEANLWKNKFVRLKEAYTKLSDNAKRSLSETKLKQIEYLNTNMQILQDSLNNKIKELNEKTIKHGASEINRGKIESAVREFKEVQVQDDSALSKIITSVYGEYGNVTQIDNILNFIKALPSCDQGKIAYQILLDEMRKGDHLKSPYVLIVDNAVKDCMCCDSSLIKKFEPYVINIIDFWAYKVRNNNDNAEITDFARKNLNIFKSKLPQIIDKAYASLENVENIILFLRDLSFISTDDQPYLYLFNKMKSNGHLNSYQLVMLAYNIKQFFDNQLRGGRFDFNRFETVRDNLPNSIKKLIWNGRCRCTIKNEYYSEYLYTSSYAHANWPYTWVGGSIGTDGYWELNMLENGKYFTIRNIYYNMFLHSQSTSYDKKRKYIATKKCRDGINGPRKFCFEEYYKPDYGVAFYNEYKYKYYDATVKKDILVNKVAAKTTKDIKNSDDSYDGKEAYFKKGDGLSIVPTNCSDYMDHDAQWILKPEGSSFLILNRDSDEYLFANDWGVHRRYVFGDSDPDSASMSRKKWKIDCQPRDLCTFL